MTFQAVTALICSNSCHRFSIAWIGYSFGCVCQRCLKLAEISSILADFTQVAGYLSISGKMLKITQIPCIPTIFCHFKQVKCQNVITSLNFVKHLHFHLISVISFESSENTLTHFYPILLGDIQSPNIIKMI